MDSDLKEACLNGLKNLVHVRGMPLPAPDALGIRIAIASALGALGVSGKVSGDDYQVLMDFCHKATDEDMISILEDT